MKPLIEGASVPLSMYFSFVAWGNVKNFLDDVKVLSIYIKSNGNGIGKDNENKNRD